MGLKILMAFFLLDNNDQIDELGFLIVLDVEILNEWKDRNMDHLS